MRYAVEQVKELINAINNNQELEAFLENVSYEALIWLEKSAKIVKSPAHTKRLTKEEFKANRIKNDDYSTYRFVKTSSFYEGTVYLKKGYYLKSFAENNRQAFIEEMREIAKNK